MRLRNEQFTVFTSVETMPPLSQFDIVYNLNEAKIDDFYMARILKVDSLDGTSKSIALIEPLCASYEPHAVLENNLLTLILFDSIVQVNLCSGLIEQHKDCANWGGLHEIHGIGNGYIICGECDIFRYDLELNLIWHFMGRDILASPKKNKHFWIEEKFIHCRDLLGWKYVLDFDGNVISDFRETPDSETL